MKTSAYLKLASSALAASLVLLAHSAADGADVRSGDRVVIDVDTTIDDDLYIGANIVDIDGFVRGDVFAAGERISIRGNVQGGVFVVARTVIVEGHVAGSVHAAGSDVRLASMSRIDGDVTAAGQTLVIAGHVARDALLGANRAELLGSVNGKTDAAVGSLIIGERAQIGPLTYRSAQEARVASGSQVSSIERKAMPANPKPFFGAGWFLAALAALASGAVLIRLAPLGTRTVIDRMRGQPWASLGWGLALLVVTPPVSFLTMLTVLGIPLGLVLLALYVVALYLAYLVAARALGEWILVRYRRASPPSAFGSLAVGLVVLTPLALIPVLGGIVNLTAVVFGLGAGWLAMRDSQWFNRTFRRVAPRPDKPLPGSQVGHPSPT